MEEKEEDEEEENESKKLGMMIEKATNSTCQEIDPRLLKAIKSTVRSSDSNVRCAVHSLLNQLKKDHSQVRYLALLVIDELFMRSKLFRSLLVVNFEQFLSLSVGFRRNLPLPPPRNVAALLRSKSIEFLEKWHATFGIHYRQLRSGFEYLKNTLKYQFPNRLENTARLQQERRERGTRTQEILLCKFETLKETHSTIKNEIQSALDEIRECLDIVRVKEDEIVKVESVDDDGLIEYKGSVFWQIRMESLKEGERVYENSDNSAVFDVLRELYKLLVSRHLPSVQEWISVLVRVDLADNRSRNSILKEFIDLRNDVQAVKKRCEELGFALPSTASREEEDLWEEGRIEVSDNKSVYAPVVINGKKASSSMNEEGNAKTVDVNEKSRKGKEVVVEGDGLGSQLREKLLSQAPVVPWGHYLENWGSKREFLANQRGLELESHWGRVDHDAMIPAEKIAELSLQATAYKEERGEIRPCLAPLSKGGLCQRRDLRICPFHGPIVPRDAEGNPIVKTKPSSMSEKIKDELRTPEECANSLEEGNSIVEQLAKRAIKNVRDRDREAKKNEIDRQLAKRAKLAKVREHNEAVLRSAALASTSRSEAVGGDTMTMHQNGHTVKGKKQTLASMLHEKVTTKQRIAKKLLNSRVTDSAIRQLRNGEEANYREAFANQW